MNKVIILTDSTCDLSLEDRQKYGIEQFSLYVNFDETQFKDGVDIDPAKLFVEVKNRKKLPKSSCPTFVDIYTILQHYIDNGYDVFYTGIGGGFSGTLSLVNQVAEEIGQDRVFTFDSSNLSSGVGYTAIMAAKLRNEGKSAKEIVEILEVEKTKIRTQFVIDSLEYLHKGGRCSGMTRVVGTLLKIKPNIKVVDGGMVVARKFRGMKQGCKGMLEDLTTDYNNNLVDDSLIFVTHCFASEYAKELIDEIIALGFKKENIIEGHAGCVISTHCGEGTIGIIYKLK